MFIKKNYIEFILMHGKKVLKAFTIVDRNQFKELKNINNAKSTDVTANVYKSKNQQTNDQPEYEECLSCQ